MSDSFVFYKSFMDAIDKIENPAERLQAYEAIARYATTGEMPEAITGAAEIVFIMARPVIESSAAKRESGKKGGRPKNRNHGSDNKKTMVSENENHGFENENYGFENKKPPFSNKKTMVSENENHRFSKTKSNEDVDEDVDGDVDKDVDVAVGENTRVRACETTANPAADPATTLPVDENVKAVFQEFQSCGYQINQHSRDVVLQMITDYGGEWTKQAIIRAADRGNKSLSYIRGILNSWQTKGAIDDEWTDRNRGHPAKTEKVWTADDFGGGF